MQDIDNSFKKTLSIEIHDLQKDRITEDGEPCDIIYFKLTNQTLERITFSNNPVVTKFKNNCQYNKDHWLIGYLPEPNFIEKNSSKIIAAMFIKRNGNDVDSNTHISIEIEDFTNGILYNAKFSLSNKKWELIKLTLNSPNIDKQIFEKNLNKNIERIESFEEKLGIKLENISVKVNDDMNHLEVNGEIYSLNDEDLKDNVQIKCNFYDNNGNILYIIGDVLYSENFMGYDSFSFWFSDETDVKRTNNIKIFTTKV